jgi:hypothetical protein
MREVEARCSVCNAPVVAGGGGALRCPDCFEVYLRGIDAAFLDNLSRFGIRSRQVVAETCLRALVLADVDDRKLLGIQVYQQFVQAAHDLIGLVAALRRRGEAPIARSFLDFTLDADGARGFFADLIAGGPARMLHSLGLPHPAALPPLAGYGRKERKELEKALHYAVADLDKVAAFRDLGERALALAADHLNGMTALTDRTQWVANGRAINPTQVASIALDPEHGRLDIAALRIDEERLEQVVDGVDIFTRLARNLIHAFLTLHDPAEFERGFDDPLSAARTG